VLNASVQVDRSKFVGTRSKVVPADVFESLIDARTVIAQARAYAATLRANADAHISTARETGFAEGRERGQAEVAARMVETTAAMQAAFVQLEARIVHTVLHAVRQILRELDESTVMERLVRRVLAETRAQKQVRLRVSAAQFELVNASLATILADFPDVEFIDVLKDPRAAPGTCVLESEFGVIDGSVETQLAAVRRGLIDAFVGKRVAATVPSE
jgi:type III secretion protein L